MQQWWFIDTQYYQYFFNMFRVPLHPSSGGQIVLPDGRQHPRNSGHISPPSSPEPSQPQPEHNTIGSNTQHDLPS
jgi:hypothetical protein